MAVEEFRPIEGYHGYKVSNFGRVWSSKTNKILKTQITQLGYVQVQLYSRGKCRILYVHRLVAKAFCENPNKKLEVNHKDENKRNNRASNLEWVTRSENINYGSRNRKASENHCRKVRCVETGKVFRSLREAGDSVGAKYQNIAIACDKSWRTSKGFHWESI